ncbi:MAG: helicase-related protein, partial [Bacilli bacterium]|nr:helicase-related protein [Bacilli bacterium]
FFTNKNGNTLIKKFEGVLANNPMVKNLDAVVGFLRSSGYFELHPFLKGIDKVRVLIGIDVDKFIADAANRGQLFFGDPEGTREEYLAQYKHDIENSPYLKEVEDGILQMLQDITDGKLELRAHPSKKIHAKIYIIYPQGFNEDTLNAAVITGSSNLSSNGLGTSVDKQYEFNVLLHENEDVKFAMDEFNELWEEAKDCPITAQDIQTTNNMTYLKGDVTPYDLYIKMLMEYFGDRVKNEDAEDPYEMPEGYDKYDYQIDAVNDGYEKLLKYDGFFLADVVGLGKTIIATMIAKKFLIENGRENTKILVVYPPAVEQNWKTTFKDFSIDKYTRFISNGSLDKILDDENYNYWNADEYDLVLVDEAHKFRNHTSGSFGNLQEICKMPRLETGNIDGYKKKVILISATPMNNTPMDIYNELLLFQDPRRCTIDGCTNLTSFFGRLDKEFKALRRNPDYDLNEYKHLAEQVRRKIIKPVTVRRTRSDIESVPRYNKDINGFPKVEHPNEERYELNDHLADLFEKSMAHLIGDVSYARYQAIAGLKPEISDGLYDNVELVSKSLANIRKTGLVKRLESSFYAFKVSLKRFSDANKNMINMFANGKVFIAPDMDINHLYELGMTDDEIEEWLNQKSEDNPKNAVFKPEDFKPEFVEDLKHDQEVIDEIVTDWEDVTNQDDSKFNKFSDLLKHEFFNKTTNPDQKLVVFSESLDTVKYLKERIKREDVLVISSDNRGKEFKTIRGNFDANYKDKKNDYNIILTTDALAEGVNLHRSNVIVNYDTPWNSTKLMQRIGRVNRIGSMSKHIYNYVFYPSREGDKEIRLNRIALSKLQTFHTTFGEDNQIYSTEEVLDTFDKLFDEKVSKEDVNEEIQFYEELRDLYQNHRKEYNRISRLSLRSRTGRESKECNGITLSNETFVFLKTNLRKAFYRVSDQSDNELSSIEALHFFKALTDEQPVERIEHHHEHVEKACQAFKIAINQGLANEDLTAGTGQNAMGAQVGIAVSLLNTFLAEIQDSNTRILIAQLQSLVRDGVITYIPKRLQRISKRLRKGLMSHDDALNEIIAMAKKYSDYFVAEEERKKRPESKVEIILSESFK